MDSPIYNGFKIYAYYEGISPNKQPEIEHKLQTSFSCEDWYIQDSHIYNENFYAPIKVEFKTETNEQEWKMGLNGYGLVFNCVFFAKDTWQNICSHKNFCTKVLNKITWKKQAFYLIDGKMIPLPTTKRLKQKRRKIKRSKRQDISKIAIGGKIQ